VTSRSERRELLGGIKKFVIVMCMRRVIRKPNLYLPLLLLFILADILCDNTILRTFNKQSPSLEFWLFVGMLLLQAIASPIQSGFSDFSCRKKSLIVSLSSSSIALAIAYFYNLGALLYFPVLVFMLLIKGALGNTIPLSWAAIADTQEKNVRFSFALSTASFAVGYLLLIYANKYLSREDSVLIILLFLLVLVFLSATLFKDIRDKNGYKTITVKQRFRLIFNDVKLILYELSQTRTRDALLAFLLWEISLYSILLLYVDFEVEEFSKVALGMIFGSLVGIFSLRFLTKLSDKVVIRIGFNISSVSLIPFFINIIFTRDINFILLSFCYSLHMLGNALLGPTLFSILAKDKKPHEQGKIYGLIESVDTISFLISTIAVIIYNFYRLNLLFIIGLSFITVALSWFPYARYERSRVKAG
jgi:MFS family permease